jgi:hypothetical protein
MRWHVQEAAAASALNGTHVVDRALVVEQAAVAAKTKDAGGANPFAALQQQQVHAPAPLVDIASSSAQRHAFCCKYLAHSCCSSGQAMQGCLCGKQLMTWFLGGAGAADHAGAAAAAAAGRAGGGHARHGQDQSERRPGARWVLCPYNAPFSLSSDCIEV